ncbi:MAG: hypothetical protein LUE63_06015 [Lachnospiraceae bacterium]|nr:hypothetical protein [Lachnospiraceae bacterium]
MKSHYEDKDTEFAAYRMVQIGMNVGVVLVAVIAVAAAVPDISGIAMSALCLVLTLAALVHQIRLDRYHILSGEFLVEDGRALYIVIGEFGLGFGRAYHRQNQKRLKAYRYFCVTNVRSVKVYPFGIRLKAEGLTATSREAVLDENTFATPGAAKKILEQNGRRKTQVFHIEHNLKPAEEQRLLRRLEGLMSGEGGSGYGKQ